MLQKKMLMARLATDLRRPKKCVDRVDANVATLMDAAVGCYVTRTVKYSIYDRVILYC